MARFDRVRSVLVQVVLAQLAAAGVVGCCGEKVLAEEDINLRDPSAEMATLLSRCATNADDCMPLCEAALRTLIGDEGLAYAYIEECTLTVTAGMDGPIVHVVYDDGSACGRAPRGLSSSGRVASDDEVGVWLAEAAHLEAASVIAFVRLAVDLARLGAPQALIAAAVDAAHDEVEHAAVMRELAHERGVEVVRVQCGPYRPASLLELAMHNAGEGCVRETLGAAINAWQGQAASDPDLRRAFAKIAIDEARHAELSWRIDAWAQTRLSADEIAAVAQARAHASSVIGELASCSSVEARDVLGLPSATGARKLADAVCARLAA